MKVLWLSASPSMFETSKTFGWIASLENVVHQYLDKNVKLGIAFEAEGDRLRRTKKNKSVYYQIPKKYSLIDGIKRKFSAITYWRHLEPYYRRILDDFKPDIIHCFGSEWPFGNIVKITKIPVVIHIQGFLNTINLSEELAVSFWERIRINIFHPVKIAKSLIHMSFKKSTANDEQSIMKLNHYFMGRSEWDRYLVKYYSPGAKYYHVPEAIRPVIYNEKEKWKYHNRNKLRLLTISRADNIKGNGMILYTAKILKEVCRIEFEWRVTGEGESFSLFEKKTGIKAEDVGVCFIGMIDAESVVDELQKADFYIHPSMIENASNAVCEAQLIGCPVIAAYVGGLPSILKDKETGFLYPYNEAHTLAFKICDLMKEEKLLTKVSDNERKVSHERHSPERIAEILFATYKNIINN